MIDLASVPPELISAVKEQFIVEQKVAARRLARSRMIDENIKRQAAENEPLLHKECPHSPLNTVINPCRPHILQATQISTEINVTVCICIRDHCNRVCGYDREYKVALEKQVMTTQTLDDGSAVSTEATEVITKEQAIALIKEMAIKDFETDVKTPIVLTALEGTTL